MSTRITAAVTIVALAIAARASAQDTVACGVLDLALEGASARSETEEADFSPAWQPRLEEGAACLAAPEHARACLEVQGQYDDQVFEPAIARALGGHRAAQLHRARGRAEAVIAALADLGVAYDRIRHRPPPAAATYRGVQIRVLDDCLAAPPVAQMPAWAATPEALATSLNQAGLVAAPPAPVVVEPPPPPPPIGPLSVDGALRLDFATTRPEDSFAFGVRTAIGWGENRLYLRAILGMGTSDRLVQRAHVEYGLGGGFRPLRWLRVGGLFLHRVGSFRAFDPWLEQELFLAVESEQRLVQLARVSVWVGETLAPLGFRVQRATVVSGQYVNSHDTLDYAFAAMLTVTVRGHLRAATGAPGSYRPTR